MRLILFPLNTTGSPPVGWQKHVTSPRQTRHRGAVGAWLWRGGEGGPDMFTDRRKASKKAGHERLQGVNIDTQHRDWI